MRVIRLDVLAGLVLLAACRSGPAAPPVGMSTAIGDTPACSTCAEERAAPAVWRAPECPYPRDWEGPGEGGIALFHAATPDEIRAAHPGFLEPTDPSANAFKETLDDPRWDEELAASYKAGEASEARLARIDIEGIEGQEVSVLPSEGGSPLETPLPIFLVGPKVTPVYEIPAAVTARFAREKDPAVFGKAWAAALLEHSRVPPKLTPEEEATLRQEARRVLGHEPSAEELKWTPPDADAFRAAGWVAVACELTQLARYAERTGRRIYLEWYQD